MTSARFATLLFWFGCLLIALVSLRATVAPVALTMPHMAHYLGVQSLGLWLHIVGAPIALALAPFQLWPGLRRRRPGLHRWTGRVYAVAFVLSALGALMLLPHFTGSPFAATGFALLAILSIVTTVMGAAQAMRRNVAAHRRWMLRSVALVFAAVTLRIQMIPLMMAGWSLEQTYDVTAWLSWTVSLVALELWLARSRRQGAAVVQPA